MSTEDKAQDLLRRFEFFCNTCLKIEDKNGDLVPFALNHSQRRLVLALLRRYVATGRGVRAIVLKGRQMGISTVVGALFYFLMLTSTGLNTLIISHEVPSAARLFKMVELFDAHLPFPDDVRPQKEKQQSGRSLRYGDGNGGGLRAEYAVRSADTTVAARSQTIHLVHESEVAFWRDPWSMTRGLHQSVPRESGWIIQESTADGAGNYFHQHWIEASKEGSNSEFLPIFLAWWMHEEYCDPVTPEEEALILATTAEQERKLLDAGGSAGNVKWMRWCLANNCNGKMEVFLAEYPIVWQDAFQSSGRNIFPVSVLADLLGKAEAPREGYLEENEHGRVVFVPQIGGRWRLFREPSSSETYTSAWDTSQGLQGEDKDYSGGCVVDAQDNDVCTYHGKPDPESYARDIALTGRYYNNHQVVVEANNHGHAVLVVVRQIYDNIYARRAFDKKLNVEVEKLGWWTDKATKPMIEANMIARLKRGGEGMRDERVLSELMTYIEHPNGEHRHEDGKHDDLAMPRMIVSFVVLGSGKDASRAVVAARRADFIAEELPKVTSKVVVRSWSFAGGAVAALCSYLADGVLIVGNEYVLPQGEGEDAQRYIAASIDALKKYQVVDVADHEVQGKPFDPFAVEETRQRYIERELGISFALGWQDDEAMRLALAKVAKEKRLLVHAGSTSSIAVLSGKLRLKTTQGGAALDAATDDVKLFACYRALLNAVSWWSDYGVRGDK